MIDWYIYPYYKVKLKYILFTKRIKNIYFTLKIAEENKYKEFRAQDNICFEQYCNDIKNVLSEKKLEDLYKAWQYRRDKTMSFYDKYITTQV